MLHCHLCIQQLDDIQRTFQNHISMSFSPMFSKSLSEVSLSSFSFPSPTGPLLLPALYPTKLISKCHCLFVLIALFNNFFLSRWRSLYLKRLILGFVFFSQALFSSTWSMQVYVNIIDNLLLHVLPRTVSLYFSSLFLYIKSLTWNIVGIILNKGNFVFTFKIVCLGYAFAKSWNYKNWQMNKFFGWEHE